MCRAPPERGIVIIPDGGGMDGHEGLFPISSWPILPDSGLRHHYYLAGMYVHTHCIYTVAVAGSEAYSRTPGNAMRNTDTSEREKLNVKLQSWRVSWWALSGSPDESSASRISIGPL